MKDISLKRLNLDKIKAAEWLELPYRLRSICLCILCIAGAGCEGLKVRADHGEQGTDINIHVPPSQPQTSESQDPSGCGNSDVEA